MWTLLIAVVCAQQPMPREDAQAFAATLSEPEWHTRWQALVSDLDRVADPADGPTETNHEAAAALALAAGAVAEHDLDVSLIDDSLRAQLVQRNPLRRDYDMMSVSQGAAYRDSLRDAVVALGRDPRSLCIELRAARARHQAGDSEEALEQARAAVTSYTHPYDVAVAKHLVGQLLMKSGDIDGALTWLEQALAVYDPEARDQPHAPMLDRAILYADLKLVYTELGRERDVKQMTKRLKKARKTGPNDSLWEQDQERLEVRLGEPFQGTCWEGDAWWASVAAGELPGLVPVPPGDAL